MHSYIQNIYHKISLLFAFCLLSAFFYGCHPFSVWDKQVSNKQDFVIIQPPEPVEGGTRLRQAQRAAGSERLQDLIENHRPGPTAAVAEMAPDTTVIIGRSVEGRSIEVVQFGNGPKGIILIGGIHGGYEANTVVLLHQMIKKLRKNPEVIPPNVSVYIIPTMNPDGQEKERMAGRVNGNGVDLNRNWGCDWMKNEGYYYGQYYHTGTREFSEPETQHVLKFILSIQPAAVIFYHSRGAFIFYGECGTLVDSEKFAEFASNATGYPVYNPTSSFGDEEPIPITGDATNYLDSIGISAIGIELSSHDSIDWEQNYSGLLAIFGFVRALEEP